MYEKLVKELRELSHEFYLDDNNKYAEEKLKQAADAIEEMTAYVRQIEELRKDGYYLQKTKMMTCGQATMTMPLPEPPKEE